MSQISSMIGNRGIAPQAAGVATAVPKAPKISLAQATFGGKGMGTGMSPNIGFSPAPASAPAQTATPWNARMGSQLSSALAGNTAPAAIPPSGSPAPSVAPKTGLLGKAFGSSKGLFGGLGSRIGPAIGPMVVQAAIGAVSNNPSEGFMHLGAPGSFREGARRLMTSAGHAISGESQPGDVSSGELRDALMHHTWIGDTLTGLGNIGHTLYTGVTDPGGLSKDFGRGLSVLGDRWFGQGEQPQGDTPVHLGMTQSEMNGMNADQLNARYSAMGIGGPNRVGTASLSAAAPKSGDTPALLGQSLGMPNPQGQDTGIQMMGPQGWETYDPTVAKIQDAMRMANESGDFGSTASLAHALSGYRGATGANAAQMMGAQAELEKARNPLAGYMNPVGLQLLDAQAGDTGNVIGAANASGIGLGPHGEFSPQGLSAYTGIRFPDFSGVVGNKDATLDQFRDMYERTKSRFASGDSQLSEIQNYLSQVLRSRYSPEEMDAASQPGWFGMGAEGARRTSQFLRELGVR